MSSPEIQCPECGAPVAFRGTAVSAVCEYCDSTVVRTGVDVKLIGKVSALIDNGSPVLLHSKGKFNPNPAASRPARYAGAPAGRSDLDLRVNGVPFVVAGRLQVQYERGTWNEWYLEFADGTIGWLSDAQNQFAVVVPIDPNQVAGRVPSFDELQIGQQLRVAGRVGVVVDHRGADYKGAEGVLPFEAEPGMTYYGADLRGYAGEFVTLDWGTEPDHREPLPYVGRAVTLRELGLFPLRRFEGWPPATPPNAQQVAPS